MRDLGYGTYAVSLYNDIEYVESAQRKYSFLKNGEYILPSLFDWDKRRYGKKQNNIILQLFTKAGIFNLDTCQWATPTIYRSLINLEGDSYLAMDKNFKIINSANQVKDQFEWDLAYKNNINNKEFLIVTQGKKVGVYDFRNNKYTIPIKYSRIETFFKSKYFKVMNEYMEFNLIDTNGVVQNKEWYRLFAPTGVHSGLFLVIDKSDRNGIMDREGNLVVPLNFQYINQFLFYEKLLLARNMEGKYGFVDIDGDTVLPFIYDYLNYSAHDYRAIVFHLDNKRGVIKMNNGSPSIFIQNEYDFIVLNKGYFFVEKNNKHGVIDFKGNLAIPIKYKAIDRYNNFIVAKDNDKSLIYNFDNGKLVFSTSYDDIKKIIYSESSSASRRPIKYSSDYLAIIENNKVGIIDDQGDVIIAPSFEDIVEVSNGKYIIAKLNGMYGIYNVETQSTVIDFNYDCLIHDRYFKFYGWRKNELYSIKLSLNKDEIKEVKIRN